MSSQNRNVEQVYVRHLPGGGFVAIQAKPVRTLLGQRRYRGAVVVERRIDRDRRAGHAAPTVASAEARTIATLLHELLPVAESNAALASRCLAAARGRQFAGA